MQYKTFFYHENNIEHPYAPQEDYYANLGDIFAVADGITLDPDKNGILQFPSDALETSKIFCDGIVATTNYTKDHMVNRFTEISKKIHAFNTDRERYLHREDNAYSFGASVAASAFVDLINEKLIYAFLDDCRVAIFDKDFNNKIPAIPYVKDSAIVFQKYKWDAEGRKYWRGEIRNNKLQFDGKEIGYGALDGREGFEQYIQSGEIKLESGDLVCVYSDGIMDALNDKNFVKLIKENEFNGVLYKIISKYLLAKGLNKEKTVYFIKIA